jgi:type IV pilus assembly protein PilF
VDSISRNALSLCASRLRLTGLAVVVLLVSSACVTPTTYETDDPSIVSEAQAKRDLGIDYLSNRRTAMAIRELTASLDMDSDDPQTHLWLGEAYRRKGKTAKAESFLLDALEIAQDQEDDQAEQEARLNLSALLSQMGRYEDSLVHCEELAADPTFATPWRPLSNCGWALMKLGRLPEARRHFEDALDFFPRFSPALLNLGILEAQLGHSLAAVKALDKALSAGRLRASGHAEANYRLGEIYVELGRRAKAVEHFGAAAKIAPDANWGSESQAYLDLLR